MSNREPALRIETVPGPDACWIRIRGELDLAGCPGLELVIGEAEQTQARRIILDLEQLRFIDSAGLGALLNASRRSASNGGRLRITPGTGHVADMFRLTALDKTLPLLRTPIRSGSTAGGVEGTPAATGSGR
jgi:anti-sigma B factor antagonist